MGANPVAVVDTNVLLNLATPVVDGRERAPSGGDPLRTVLTAYDVHAPDAVIGEVADATGGGDLLAAAAEAVMLASDHLTTRDVGSELHEPLDYGLDPGESRGIWLANEIGADLFVTDEFATNNYLLVALHLDDRNTLFTSPHVLCKLAECGVLGARYVDDVLAYLCDLKHWDEPYVDRLRDEYLSR